MKLAYQAFDKSGQAVQDVIDAADTTDAMESLRRRGLYVTQIAASTDPGATGPRPSAGRRGAGRLRLRWGRRLKNLAMFTRQLYVLVSTGTQLTQALFALERQAKDEPWRQVLEQVRIRVEEGTSLSEAMRDHPNDFDPIYCSLIAAGETAGKLPTILDRLAGLTRQQLHVRNSVLGAMIYPCLLVAVSLAVLTLMLGFVLPRFAELFKTLDVALPPTTVALMWASDMVRSFWWVMLLMLGAGAWGVRFWLGTPSGKQWWDTVAVRAPQIGRITRSFATAKIARLLGILLDSHLPLLESLSLVRQATGNVHYAALMTNAEQAVTRGEPVSSAFADTRLIDPSVYEGIRSGEHSGNTGPVLLTLADFLDEENEVVLRSLTSILEPVILIVMGAMVGLIALSMYLPLFDLAAMSSGGAG